MSFQSILFDRPAADRPDESRSAPDFFQDLHLHPVIDAITGGRDEYALRPFFYAPLRRLEAVNYRYDVLRDLESPAVQAAVAAFSKRMRQMREHLEKSVKAYYPLQKSRWFVDAAHVYCEAVETLTSDLSALPLHAVGWRGLRGYLTGYTDSDRFRTLAAHTRQLLSELSDIRYCLFIHDGRVEVSRYDAQSDYNVDIAQAFAKFERETAKEYAFRLIDSSNMNHVEAAILDRVALLFPDIFESLLRFPKDHREYLDPTLAAFDREVQFYVACLEHMNRLEVAGLAVCYPEVSDRSKELYGREVFDLALAERLLQMKETIVANDFALAGDERILVVSGANQGGKSTFARMFGQLHYLASIGCPVPGRAVKVFLFDQLFTHFEREETVTTLTGKLERDLMRIHDILSRATSNSILIMNESFASTTLSDALFLNKQIMRQVIDRDMLCVSVTFFDELASFADAIVSMVSTIDPTRQDQRTYKILQRPADGMAYAAAIAARHDLTYERIKERLLA